MMPISRTRSSPDHLRHQNGRRNGGDVSLSDLAAIEDRAVELRQRILDFQDKAADKLRQNVTSEQREILQELLVISARFVGIASDIHLNVTDAMSGKPDSMFEFHGMDEVESILDRVEIFCCLAEDVC